MNSGDDGFLTRWSRRKAEAKQAEPAPVPLRTPGESDPAAPEPEIDLDLLPSLEELTEATDITGFLKKGVPEALRNAALRKMWETDVAIRDYIGPADFQWDFNSGTPFAGYGTLTPGADIAGMVREIADYHLKAVVDAEIPAEDGPAALPVQPGVNLPAPEDDGGADTATAVVPIEGAASAEPDDAVAFQPRRRHGGATPR